MVLYVVSWDGFTKLRYGLTQRGLCRLRSDRRAKNASRDLKMHLRAIRPVLKYSAVCCGSTEHHYAVVGSVLHCRLVSSFNLLLTQTAAIL